MESEAFFLWPGDENCPVSRTTAPGLILKQSIFAKTISNDSDVSYIYAMKECIYAMKFSSQNIESIPCSSQNQSVQQQNQRAYFNVSKRFARIIVRYVTSTFKTNNRYKTNNNSKYNQSNRQPCGTLFREGLILWMSSRPLGGELSQDVQYQGGRDDLCT